MGVKLLINKELLDIFYNIYDLVVKYYSVKKKIIVCEM